MVVPRAAAAIVSLSVSSSWGQCYRTTCAVATTTATRTATAAARTRTTITATAASTTASANRTRWTTPTPLNRNLHAESSFLPITTTTTTATMAPRVSWCRLSTLIHKPNSITGSSRTSRIPTTAASTALVAERSVSTRPEGDPLKSTPTPPPPTPPPPTRFWAQGVGFVGAASLLVGKTKYVVAALKVTKLASLGSMALSVGAYSMVFGVPYAVGMVGLIFVHECGHAIVMVQRGMPFTPMVFIPFMGAVIATKEHPRDAWDDALIAMGGPIAGSMAAGSVALAATVTDSQLLYALADFGYMINLFNLLPIGSMDGGRWVGALSKYVGVVGTGLGGVIAYYGLVSNPLFYLIWLAGGYETVQRFWNPQLLPPNFYAITTAQRAALTGGYVGLVVVLLTAMSANQQKKKSPERIQREQQGEITWDSRY